jgi:hypothetical protein
MRGEDEIMTSEEKWKAIEEIYKTATPDTPCWLNVTDDFLSKTTAIRALRKIAADEYAKLAPAQKLLCDFHMILERQLTLFGYMDPMKAIDTIIKQRQKEKANDIEGT